MGMSAQQLLQNDPEYLRRQLAAQEIQRLNPQGTAAGAIGALFGRGIGNIASNRGFFDIGDAGLRRVSDVQAIMSRAQFDPSNPAGYYEQIGKDLQTAGYGDLAPMALQEAAKFRKEAAVETRAQAAESRAASAERRASYQFNPELAIEDAGKLAEDDPQRTTLLSLAARLMEKDNFDRAAKTVQITASEADAIYKRALAGKAVKEAAQGTKQWERAGMDALGNVTLFNPFTGETKVLKGVLSDSAASGSAPGATAQDTAAANAAAALERKRKQDTTSRQRAAGTEEITIGLDGQVETRIVANVPATAQQIGDMTIAELQEYNRTGKIPRRLIGQ